MGKSEDDQDRDKARQGDERPMDIDTPRAKTPECADGVDIMMKEKSHVLSGDGEATEGGEATGARLKPGRLFLTKVPYDVTKEDLTSDFQQNGQLEAAFVTTGKSTGLKRKAAGETAAPPVHPKKKREGKNTLLTGRVAGTPGLTLAVKLSIIQWAEKEGFIKRHDNDNQYTKVAAEYAVDTSWAGGMQHRKINKIRDWANESLRDDWRGFSTDARMQKEYGITPLTQFCRLPNFWYSLKARADDGASVSPPRRRGKLALKDKYSVEIQLLQKKQVLELSHDVIFPRDDGSRYFEHIT